MNGYIEAEIDRAFEIIGGPAGLMFAVGNHLPANIPIENAEFYIDTLRRRWQCRPAGVS